MESPGGLYNAGLDDFLTTAKTFGQTLAERISDSSGSSAITSMLHQVWHTHDDFFIIKVSYTPAAEI